MADRLPDDVAARLDRQFDLPLSARKKCKFSLDKHLALEALDDRASSELRDWSDRVLGPNPPALED